MQLGPLVMCFVAACTGADLSVPAGRLISGVVVDHATHLPVAGAQVFGPWGTVQTGVAGEFHVEVPAGTRELRVAKAGYEDVRRVGLREEPILIGMFPVAPDEQALMSRRGHVAEDPAKLKASARALDEAIELHDGDLPAGIGPRATLVSPPSIRVWRRGLDGSTDSCQGRVDVIPFEDYVKGSLPHEWLLSWDPKSLQMGAVAVRTYAWFWVNRGGRYDCADLDDTTRSQVYKDERYAKTDAAVDATAGTAIVKDGALVVAEYSAENGDPTAFGVDEPHCTGKAVNGHGRGTCQWGTQRWAVNEGKDYLWMSAHYYPGAQAVKTGWAATFVASQFPTQMTAGESVEVFLSYTNQGSEAWSLGEVRLGTTEPRERQSPFHVDADWLDPSHPTSVDTDVAPGAVGRFSFRIQAPEVTTPTDFVEHFALEGPEGWFGPEDNRVSLSIKVVPRTQPIEEEGEDVNLDDEVSGGCEIAPARPPRKADFARLGLFLLLGAAVARRGRRWTVVYKK
jgi:hypothetical protein